MNKKEKLFMAALGWLHDGLLFGCLFLIPAGTGENGRDFDRKRPPAGLDVG